MSRALSMIDSGLMSGFLSEEEHDKIMELIHKDGKIDSEESKKLSELFSAIKSGNLKIVVKPGEEPGKENSDKALSESCYRKDALNEALTRDMLKSSQASQPIQKSAFQSTNELLTKNRDDSFLPQTTKENTTRPVLSNDDETTDCSDYFSGLKIHEFSKTPEAFNKANDRLLEANLNGKIWIKTGSMVAYQGAINFRREGIAEHGISKLIKRKFSGEHTLLTAAEGQGILLLADQGKKICITDLNGIPLYIQAEHLLAFENGVKWDVQPLFNIGTALAGGLFHICLSGKGHIAFTSQYDPVVLRVKPGQSIMTDAAATVGWTSGVVPNVKTDINLQTLIGRGSGETIQLRFEGDGAVIIQPFETKFENNPTP
ncbi:MAG TPA: AIM24 family protein [Oligoflexia bacterium]|nr:AIM24 family protein [Oligoflexia bacterium]HMP48913.1 AIM24 family protein [Oligoflexia bacterium]